MNKEQQQSVLDFTFGRIFEHDLFLSLNFFDKDKIAEKYLKESISEMSPDDVEMALLLGFQFGFSEDCLPILIKLESAKWHGRHENVVDAIVSFADENGLCALYHATQWVPDYLEYDDARALAVKAIWGIGGIGGERAKYFLEKIASNENEIISRLAISQLEKFKNL